MKKNMSLQVLFAMGCMIGVTSMVQAYNDTSKYTDKQTKKSNAKSVKKEVAPKVDMKSIERDLAKIRRDFRKGTITKDEALSRVDMAKDQIPQVVAEMKRSEEHGTIWETHKHTLHRKVKETREFIENFKR